jgi:glycosyltransferase involved in cell wall biosynthesis
MASPTVSVVIPTYNRARLIGRAVDSALGAVGPGDEVIVVDDGSTDDTEAVLASYGDHIRYVRTPNGGAGKARNRGVEEARCPLIAFLDSDDLWAEDKLRLQRSVMEAHPELVFCFSEFADRFADGSERRNRLAAWLCHPRVGFLDGPRTWDEILGSGIPFSSLASLPPGRNDFQVHIGDLYPTLMEVLCASTITVLVRRSAVREPSWFPQDLPTYEEWECFGRMAAAGPVAYLDCHTAWQCAHDAPRLTDADAVRCAEARITLLTRVWGSDSAFQAKYGERYHRVLARQHLIKASRLVQRARLREGWRELRLAKGSTFWDGLAAALPRSWAGSLARLRCRRTRNGWCG